MHLLIYYLIKEHVANNVINVSLFADDEITLKSIKYWQKEDKILVKMSGVKKSTEWDD